MTAVIVADKLSLRYGDRRVLDGLSMTIDAGEVVALMGPSGGGKTSLVRALLGFEVPEAGSVSLGGALATANGRLRIPCEERGLAVVFQDLALWPHLTVAKHLAFALSALRLPVSESRRRIDSMLDKVSLGNRSASYPAELSGGERRRVAIARALVAEPRAVLFDEPLVNIDMVLRDELLTLLQDLLRTREIAALYVTHDLREAAVLADRVAVLEHGRITQTATLGKLCASPATNFIRRLVDAGSQALPSAQATSK
jgi:iron(III) transport system ATP-binding protein